MDVLCCPYSSLSRASDRMCGIAHFAIEFAQGVELRPSLSVDESFFNPYQEPRNIHGLVNDLTDPCRLRRAG